MWGFLTAQLLGGDSPLLVCLSCFIPRCCLVTSCVLIQGEFVAQQVVLPQVGPPGASVRRWQVFPCGRHSNDYVTNGEFLGLPSRHHFQQNLHDLCFFGRNTRDHFFCGAHSPLSSCPHSSLDCLNSLSGSEDDSSSRVSSSDDNSSSDEMLALIWAKSIFLAILLKSRREGQGTSNSFHDQ